MTVALVVLRVVVAALLVLGPWTNTADELDGWDVERFHDLANEPGRPWVDHEVEYPPGTVVLSEAVSQGSLPLAHRLVVLIALGADLAIIALLAREGRAKEYLLLTTLLLPTVLLRFDLIATLLAVVGATVLGRQRAGVFAGSVTAGFLVKTWPALLVGAALAHRQWRALAFASAALTAATLAWIGYAGIDGPRQVATYRGSKGWQIESLGGVIARMYARLFDAGETGTTLEGGAYRFGEVPQLARVLLAVCAIGIWAASWWLAQRHPGRPPHLATVISIAGLLATSTLLSPQFLIWLAPFAALVWPDTTRALRWALTVAIAGTGAYALVIPPDASDQFLPQVLLLARGAALVAVVVFGFVELNKKQVSD